MYYYSFKKYLNEIHNKKIWRIPLSTGYPCPNRIDGKTGCSFCNGESFIAPYIKNNNSLKNQLDHGMCFFGNKFNVEYFYGYFQENTSTSGDIEELIKKFEYVLSIENILGLIISTRPDYIYPEIIQEITFLKKKFNKDIWIEMGLQSINDKVLHRINRNHTYSDFKKAVKIIKKDNILKAAVHMIIGLPQETPEDFEKGISTLFKENKIDGIKFRILDILPDTPIEKDYKKNPNDFYVFSNEDYIKILCNVLENIPEKVVIMRSLNYNHINILNKDKKNYTKDKILNALRNEFNKRNTKQGIYFNNI